MLDYENHCPRPPAQRILSKNKFEKVKPGIIIRLERSKKNLAWKDFHPLVEFPCLVILSLQLLYDFDLAFYYLLPCLLYLT